MPAALFDLDGTLHDRAVAVKAFAADQARCLCVHPDKYQDYIHRFVELDAGGKVWKDTVFAHLREEFGSPHWPSVESLVCSYIQDFPRFSVEVKGAANLLRQLQRRSVRIGILTNGRSDLQRSVIRAIGLDTMVDAIVVSEEVGCRKPEKAIFEIALAALAAKASDCVMVGDDLLADINGALGAGLYPIAFRCIPAATTVAIAEDIDGISREIGTRFQYEA